jgi:Trk K+ transport system NAD-binding subunit/Kef-type K+ transport system membrane component KefB
MQEIIVYLIGFIIIAIAANEIAKRFQKIHFPLITGLIITGVVAGSSVLDYIHTDAVNNLQFLNNIALAIIAFSAGSELYLDDLRSRLHSIKWNSIWQIAAVFVISTLAIYLLASYIPFMEEFAPLTKLVIAMLMGVIFVASSPSSAIAVINEMRANGPFTKTAMGVTVVKDVLVIILFGVVFSISKAVIHGDEIGIMFIVILLIELAVSFGLGILLGKLLQIPFNFNIHKHLKAIIIVALGFSVYLFADLVAAKTVLYLHHEIVLEPLLIAIIGSFMLTNYSPHKIEFAEIIEEISPIIYVIFFTLTGASLSIQTMMGVLGIAVVLFVVRNFAMFLAGLGGVLAAKDDKKHRFIAWMPYVTQAGVGLGLTTIVAHEFADFGHEFETIIIAIIVINQLVGPPLFKWAINYVKESHLKHEVSKKDDPRFAVIFGIENQSIALAKQLVKHNWKAVLVSCHKEDQFREIDEDEITVKTLKQLDKNAIEDLEIESAHAVVTMLTDDENYFVASTVYEHIGTQDIIVRLNNRGNFDKFHELKALIIEPALAMVSLMDHFVRSPNATSLLLGMDESQDTADVVISNKDIHGMTLRDLRLPTDVIILSVKRKGQMIISHGFTRLRLGDVVTLVGSPHSLEDVTNRFEV